MIFMLQFIFLVALDFNSTLQFPFCAAVVLLYAGDVFFLWQKCNSVLFFGWLAVVLQNLNYTKKKSKNMSASTSSSGWFF